MNDEWFYSQDGAQYGPLGENELIQLIETGELASSTPVCRKGESEWSPAREHACFQVEIFPRKKSLAEETLKKEAKHDQENETEQQFERPVGNRDSSGIGKSKHEKLSEESSPARGRAGVLGALVFFGGFAVMVLEIVGAKFLQPYFGSEFFIWVSQIGVVMLALALGYAVGGKLADRWKRAKYLAGLLVPAAVFILLIPHFSPSILNAIKERHAQPAPELAKNEQAKAKAGPVVVETNLLAELDPDFLEGGGEDNATEEPPPPEDRQYAHVPAIWKKLDPAIGSAVVFLLPCFALAMISPYMIRIAAQQVSRIGTVSGLVYSASTAGSIGGVFVTAYILIGSLSYNTIFYLTAGLTLVLAGLCCLIDRLWPETSQDESD